MIQPFQDDNDEIVEVFCSSADYTQSSSQCKNLGGSEVLDQANYASRRVSAAYAYKYSLAKVNSTYYTHYGIVFGIT